MFQYLSDKRTLLSFVVAIGGAWLWSSASLYSVRQNHVKHDAHPHAHQHAHDIAPGLMLVYCPRQPDAINIGPEWAAIDDTDFAKLAARRLSAAIQINTDSLDTAPLEAAAQEWDNQRDFSTWLENEYPSLFSRPIQHEYINVHAHLFTWQGTDSSLPPIMLMAHVDTVPVLEDTAGNWRYPPRGGNISFDETPDTPGTWIWGRGSSDCKNSLLAIYNTIERLIMEDFVPKRTILVANGFDEEISGTRGAGAIAKHLESRYGPDSLAFIVDEGFTGLSEEYGAIFGSLGMAEKGSVDVRITVEAPGGHSSMPPAHTAIGIMSKVLSALEDNPFHPTLDSRGPYIKYMVCLSEHAPLLPQHLRSAINRPEEWEELAAYLARTSNVAKIYLTTTQAIDVIEGGQKINSLPETVTALINYRISFTSNTAETLTHIVESLEPVVTRANFSLSPFDGSKKTTSHHVILETYDHDNFEPAPITSAEDPSFTLIAGTIKTVFGQDVVVTPAGMYANTDTAKMWNLSKNIYRFTPAFINETLNQHTVDERISLNAHLNTTSFYYKLIRNADSQE